MSDQSVSVSPVSDLADWLHLSLVPGLSALRQRELLSAFGLPDKIRGASLRALAEVIGETLAEKLLRHDSSADVHAALAWAEEPGNTILCLADSAYPPSLLQAADPPCVLYAKGQLALLKQPALAIVGARNATPQGEANATSFAQSLADAGLCIVSGLAAGIDAAAHRGALKGRASTIAVIGTGADRVYPARNQALARDIATSGLILSEFPLGTPAAPYNFPRRNRLIAALGRGTLVVEAAPGSGSLITARLAGELGREVLAIPGSIHSPLSRGCHQLIKQGAKLVESAQDVLEEIRWDTITQPEPAAASAEADALPNTEATRVLAALGSDPATSDTLIARTGLTADALFAILLTLELENRVARLPGDRFQRLHGEP